MNQPDNQEKAPDRRVKSVNFMDQSLYDYASRRADDIYGGNFSAYVISLIKRDRSQGGSTRLSHEIEAEILQIIEPYDGRLAPNENQAFDFEIPKLDVVIEARSRFPRDRSLEYQLLSGLQKLSFKSPKTKIVITYPNDVRGIERDRFRQFETAGIENLHTCNLDELKEYLFSLSQEQPVVLEDAPLDQESFLKKGETKNSES